MDIPAIKQLIAQGETEAALEALLELTRGTDREKEVLLLAGHFQQLRKDQRLGLTNDQQDRQRLSQINFSLLEILGELENPTTIPEGSFGRKILNKQMPQAMIGLVLVLLLAGYYFYQRSNQEELFYPFQYVASPSVPVDLRQTLDTLQQAGQNVKSIAIGSDGAWAIFYGRNKYAQNGNLSRTLLLDLDSLVIADAELQGLVLEDYSDFVVWFDQNGFRYPLHRRNLPSNLLDSLYQYHREFREVRDVATAPGNAWVVLWGRNGYIWQNVHDTLQAHLRSAVAGDKALKEIALNQDSGWVLLSGYNVFHYGYVDRELEKTLKWIAAGKKELLRVFLGRKGEWIVMYK